MNIVFSLQRNVNFVFLLCTPISIIWLLSSH